MYSFAVVVLAGLLALSAVVAFVWLLVRCWRWDDERVVAFVEDGQSRVSAGMSWAEAREFVHAWGIEREFAVLAFCLGWFPWTLALAGVLRFAGL